MHVIELLANMIAEPNHRFYEWEQIANTLRKEKKPVIIITVNLGYNNLGYNDNLGYNNLISWNLLFC